MHNCLMTLYGHHSVLDTIMHFDSYNMVLSGRGEGLDLEDPGSGDYWIMAIH